MRETLIYLDFDGVLNAFPDPDVLSHGGIGHTGWMLADDSRRQVYSAEHAFALDGDAVVDTGIEGAWPIHWSRELAGAIRRLPKEGTAELAWLSTWQPFTAHLNRTLGWNEGMIRTVHWYDAVTGYGMMGGKLEVVLKRVQLNHRADDPQPVVWVDDEEADVTALRTVCQSEPNAPMLLVRPDDRIGISRPQWRHILTFIASPPKRPLVIHDDASSSEREGHIGL